ncbi:Hsp33 family molecular chaperone HslO [Lentisphaerota bacterium ZTH]|nr:Hsp33 family molecular chaperone HslO [Lentisphaerota bacterium]WET06652.1 Hsp33 family molecular chaperone HslO [Lentisphaerota bacterium ZTH]
MSVQDFLIRGLLKKENIRFVYVNATQTVATGVKLHDTDPVAAIIFGRALTTTALLSPLLEADEKYSIRWEYSGMLGGIITDTNAAGDVRGFIRQPHLMDKAESEDDIFGKGDGRITVIKSADGKILNSGETRATLADPANDLAFFFSISDQIETEIVVAELFKPEPEDPVKIFSGLMIQAMPDCDLELFADYRKRINDKAFRKILVDYEMPVEKKLWTLLAYMAGHNSTESEQENAFYEFGASPGFRCSCTRLKMKEAMQVLDKDDLLKLYEENPDPGIVCQFCRKHYHFKKDELI